MAVLHQCLRLNYMYGHIFVILMILIMPGSGFSWPVPDTGQTACYDLAGNVIPCPSSEEPFYGQDGNYSINPMSYNKLDSSGNNLPDSAFEWVMVRDNVTGLVWEMKQDKDGITNYDNPNDADNTYTWYDSNLDPETGNAGIPGDGTDTEDFINDLNATNFGGHADWRMPSRKELRTIVDYSRNIPAINTVYFSNTQANFYWSSTIRLCGASKGAWIMNFYAGDGGGYDVYGSYCYVRAVRSGQPQSKFIDNNDGTVTDTSTGLTWQQATAPGTYTWEQALDYCEDLNLGSNSDWRLPTIKELDSIVDMTRCFPAIRTTVFPDTTASIYWSSTTDASDNDVYYTVSNRCISFSYGSDNFGNKEESNNYVRAVCGGQPGTLDSDLDGLPDSIEGDGCTETYDADTDDDGILDGEEDTNHDGILDSGETDPCNIDSDGDGIQDGTEQGVTLLDIGPDTDINIFQPDIDPTNITDPLNFDTDGNGVSDGQEDMNRDGKIDQNEMRLNLARHYSPVIYEHVDVRDELSPSGLSDFILPFNYDGNYSGDVKWENLDNVDGNNEKTEATVYYSVIESTNYWFIYYAFYHPRDWTYYPDAIEVFQHENDMESITLMIKKGNGYPGNLIAAMSMSHNVWLEYPIDSNLLNENPENDIEDGVSFIPNKTSENFIANAHHPRVYIQSRGHGVFMDTNDNACLNFGNAMNINDWDKTGFPHHSLSLLGLVYYSGTGIAYYCDSGNNGAKISEVIVIDSGNDNTSGPVDNYPQSWTPYELKSIKTELWDRKSWVVQNNIGKPWMYADNSTTFYSSDPTNHARPPWSMPAFATCESKPTEIIGIGREEISEFGEIFTDPLSAFPKHFNGLNIPSNENYLYNPYKPKPMPWLVPLLLSD